MTDDEIHDATDAEQLIVEVAAVMDQRDQAVRERDQARADLAQAVEDRERLRAGMGALDVALNEARLLLQGVKAERDRLRAVLAETPDNLRHYQEVAVLHHDEVLRMLRAIAARAGLEPTP